MGDIKDKIFIATFSAAAPKTAKEFGVGLELNDLCISSNLEPERREIVVKRMYAELAAAGREGKRTIMHGPFTELTPDSIDPRAKALMLDRYRQTVDICVDMGINDLVLHSGYIPLLYHKKWHVSQSVDFWKSFARELPDGMTVMIENVFDDEPETLRGIIEAVDEPNIKACLDIGHANAMTSGKYSIVEWVRVLTPVLRHFHVHNNDGSEDMHDDVFNGTVDFDSIMRMFTDELPDDITMTIESRRSRPSMEYMGKFF